MTEKATAPRPRLTSDERRASIVREAAKLFAARGFRGTTTRELAAACGVTEPIIYEHFKTKRDLYAALIDAKSRDGMERVAELAEQYSPATGTRDFLVALGVCIVEWYTVDDTFIRLLLFSNLEGHELKDLFHERQASKFLGFVSTMIAGRIEAGAMRSVDPAVAARTYLGMVAHYALTGLLFQCGPLPKEPRQVVEEMVDIFLNGMCVPQELK